MQVWNVLHAARWKCRTQKLAKKSPSGHHPTTLSGYIFATKARIDSRKKLVKQQYLLHMSLQYGELRPTSGWDRFVSLGHPCKFRGFHVLAALLHGTPVLGVSQTLRRWTEGATYIRQGGHHVGHWPTFLVSCWNVDCTLISYVYVDCDVHVMWVKIIITVMSHYCNYDFYSHIQHASSQTGRA